MEPPRVVQPFKLINTRNETITNADLEGHWTLLLIGYTSCPDVCPMTLARLHQHMDALMALPEPLEVWFVSVDPKRDTPEHLREYLSYFDDRIVGLTGEPDVLYELARNLNLVYVLQGDVHSEQYMVDHSASEVVIDPQGRLYGRFPPQDRVEGVPLVDPEAVAADLARMMRRYPD
jgi:protein SCO1/2